MMGNMQLYTGRHYFQQENKNLRVPVRNQRTRRYLIGDEVWEREGRERRRGRERWRGWEGGSGERGREVERQRGER